MPVAQHDVIIAGLGTSGAAAAYRLARAGLNVAGFDRFSPPHTLGSHHGESRIIRMAYYEHPAYVPLLRRAYELWAETERASGSTLVQRTGGLMIGPPDGELVAGTLASVRAHGLAHERLGAAQLIRRFPPFRVPAHFEAVYETIAGIVFPEHAVAAHLALARDAGAALCTDEPVLEWHADSTHVEVRTPRGTYRARHLVLAAGAWLDELIDARVLPLEVERQVVVHFAPRDNASAFAPERFPIYCVEQGDDAFFYGFPDLGSGAKIGRHHGGERVPIDRVDREVREQDVAQLRAFLDRTLPDMNGALRSSAVCVYTNTRDAHFVLDQHPASARVVVASICSGHGYKFSPVMGELIAKLVTGEAHGFDLSLFRLARLVASA